MTLLGTLLKYSALAMSPVIIVWEGVLHVWFGGFLKRFRGLCATICVTDGLINCGVRWWSVWKIN